MANNEKSGKDGVTDTFLAEVDEEVRRDRMMALWKRYRPFLIGGLVLMLVAVAGTQFWQSHRARQAEAASRAFAAAAALAAEGKAAEAAQAFGALAKGTHDGYSLLAAFQQAVQFARAGDKVGAVAAFDAISSNPAFEAEFRDLARYYAALHGLDILTQDDIDRRLGAIAPASPWSLQARELSAVAAMKGGNSAAARKLLTELADDAMAPPGVRGRAAELLAVLGGPQQ